MPRRPFIIALVACALIAPAGAAAATTLAPGITYQKQVRLTLHGPVVVNVITAPKPVGLYTLEPLLSNGTILGRERVTAMEKDASASSTVAGVNGDFFDPGSGIPDGMLVRGGALESVPLDERPSIGIGADGVLHVEQISYFGYWQGSGQQRKLGYNRVNPPDSYTLYTPAFGRAVPAASGSSVDVVLNSFPQAQPNIDLSAQVSAIQTGGGIPIPAGGAVLVASGSQAPLLQSEAPVGQMVTARLGLTPAWSNVASALGGGPLLVQSGVPVFNALEDFTPSFLMHRTPRTAVGQKADGTIVLVAVDGGWPAYSAGMTNFELAQTMVSLGAVTAVGLGNGASTTMAFDGQLLNRPSSPSGESGVAETLAVAYDGVYAPPPSEPAVSPNGDGVAESEILAYKVVRPSTVTATLAGPDGVARITSTGPKKPGIYPVTWNALRAGGAAELEGLWRWSITATDDLGRRSRADRSFWLNNTLGFLSTKPANLRLRPRSGKLTIAVRLSRTASTKIAIYSGAGTLVRTVFNKSAQTGTLIVSWDGRDTRGGLARSGSYEVRVTSSGALGPVELHRSFRVQRLAH